MPDFESLIKLAKMIRYFILVSTTKAESGHPTSSLSAVELMTCLLFGDLFRFDPEQPGHPNNDRLIFSKGHASPLFYSLWLAAGKVTKEELLTMREFGSPLEGHPTMAFPLTEAATGSLGQGLSVGVGMALNAQYIDKLPYRTYVLLGDSETAEGSVWEAIEIAAHYKLSSLTGIIDVNRLGQRGETLHGHNLDVYAKKIFSFGWEPFVIDGHSLEEIHGAYEKALLVKDRPSMIIARTIKGKGVSFLEGLNGWHGKALKSGELNQALLELGPVDTTVRGTMMKPERNMPDTVAPVPAEKLSYDRSKPVATRRAYGNALRRLFPQFPDIVVLDAEVSNSTFAEIFSAAHPEHFFEMYIAEQNMVGTALGLSRRGKIPFVSSFAAFLTRAYDQIRMCQYSGANIIFCGSHAGVSIGEDGSSQMGLEDLAMFRTLLNSVVLYPSDAVSTERLVEAAASQRGIVYIRTTRKDTPVIYAEEDEFRIGGSKVLRRSDDDIVTVIAAGVTLHEALAASESLKTEGIPIRVIDLYSLKPIDAETVREAAEETEAIITVEDHYAEGGIGEAVMSALADLPVKIYPLAVRSMPKSGRPDELLEYERISQNAIIKKVKEVVL